MAGGRMRILSVGVPPLGHTKRVLYEGEPPLDAFENRGRFREFQSAREVLKSLAAKVLGSAANASHCLITISDR
jgi:hypothetical protein